MAKESLSGGGYQFGSAKVTSTGKSKASGGSGSSYNAPKVVGSTKEATITSSTGEVQEVRKGKPTIVTQYDKSGNIIGIKQVSDGRSNLVAGKPIPSSIQEYKEQVIPYIYEQRQAEYERAKQQYVKDMVAYGAAGGEQSLVKQKEDVTAPGQEVIVERVVSQEEVHAQATKRQKPSVGFEQLAARGEGLLARQQYRTQGKVFNPFTEEGRAASSERAKLLGVTAVATGVSRASKFAFTPLVWGKELRNSFYNMVFHPIKTYKELKTSFEIAPTQTVVGMATDAAIIGGIVKVQPVKVRTTEIPTEGGVVKVRTIGSEMPLLKKSVEIPEPIAEFAEAGAFAAKGTGEFFVKPVSEAAKATGASALEAGRMTKEAFVEFGKDLGEPIAFVGKEMSKPIAELASKSPFESGAVILGFEKGGEVGFGTPKVSSELAQLKESGFVTETLTSQKIISESLPKEPDIRVTKALLEAEILGTPATKSILQDIKIVTRSIGYQKPSLKPTEPYTNIEAFSKGFEGKQSESVMAVYDFTLKEGGYPYGSAAGRAFKPDEIVIVEPHRIFKVKAREPKDADIMIEGQTTEQLAPKVSEFVEMQKREYGQPFKVEKGEILVETTRKDLPGHAIDTHARDTQIAEIEGAVAQESFIGISINQPRTKIGKYPVQASSEQGVRKTALLGTLRSIPLKPEGFGGKTQGLTPAEIKSGVEFHHIDYVENVGVKLTKTEHALIHELMTKYKSVEEVPIEYQDFYSKYSVKQSMEKGVYFGPAKHRAKDVADSLYEDVPNLLNAKLTQDTYAEAAAARLRSAFPEIKPENLEGLKDVPSQVPYGTSRKSPTAISPIPISSVSPRPSSPSMSASAFSYPSPSPPSYPSISPPSPPSPYPSPSPSPYPSPSPPGYPSPSPPSYPSISPPSPPSPYPSPSPPSYPSISPPSPPSPYPSPSPPSPPSISPPSSPPDSPPPSYPILFSSPSKEKKKSKYKLLVKRRGQFSEIGEFGLQQAFREGKTILSETAAASFKVEPIDRSERVDFRKVARETLPSASFRESKVTPNVFVQRRLGL